MNSHHLTHIFGDQNVPLTKILPLPVIVKSVVGEEGCLQIVSQEEGGPTFDLLDTKKKPFLFCQILELIIISN